MSHTSVGRHAAAACEVFERTTRRYDKPSFGLETTVIDGQKVAVEERVIWQRPFCRLIRFKRDVAAERAQRDPRVLLVAPMSGHFATLLRGTVETLLPNHEVFITDWTDARDVSMAAGTFDLDTYIDYVIDILQHFGGDVHVFAVCQPSVPVMAAVARMEADRNPNIPRSMILAGGPIDTRINMTAVNKLAEERGTEWFASHVITQVPWPNPGFGRSVYPGFLQLTGFMTMNLDRHVKAHKDLFHDLVRGDGDSAEKHREFYDEYLAVMDLTAEFYLQTIDTVFVRHALPKGEMRHRGERVDLGAIRRTALMTIEGEKDDITGVGQCRAAQALCTGMPQSYKLHYEAPGVGHYGIFNGSRFRAEIAPRIAQFILTHDPRSRYVPVSSPATRAEPAAITARDVASVAFTFASDTETFPAQPPQAMRAAPEDADQRTGPAPTRLWNLAGGWLIDGLFRAHASDGARQAERQHERQHTR